MFEDLVEKIEDLLLKQPNVAVAISGFAGSGKSTLADKIRDHFKISDGQVIRIDNLYNSRPRNSGLLDDYDWPLLQRILKRAHSGERLNYDTRGYEGESIVINEELPRVLVVEGVQLIRQELLNSFDLTVWVGCPLDEAIERAKKRDLEQDNGDEYMELWDAVWAPRNKEYFSNYQPDELADFLYLEYK